MFLSHFSGMRNSTVAFSNSKDLPKIKCKCAWNSIVCSLDHIHFCLTELHATSTYNLYIYIVESPVNSAPEHFGGSDPLKEKDRPASIKGKLHLLPSGGINWKSSCCTALQEKEQIKIFYHELQSLTLYQCLTRKPNGPTPAGLNFAQERFEAV